MNKKNSLMTGYKDAKFKGKKEKIGDEQCIKKASLRGNSRLA
jgi:hypothetical protein